MSLKIRALVLDDLSYDEIRDELDIPKGTWDSWFYNDTQAFRENLAKWKHERMVRKATRNLEEILDMPVEKLETGDEEDGPNVIKTDPQLVRIKADTSKFVAERLDKDNFAARHESTGKKGAPIALSLSDLLDQADKDES